MTRRSCRGETKKVAGRSAKQSSDAAHVYESRPGTLDEDYRGRYLLLARALPVEALPRAVLAPVLTSEDEVAGLLLEREVDLELIDPMLWTINEVGVDQPRALERLCVGADGPTPS